MCHLMGDDVMGKAGEDGGAWRVVPVLGRHREIAEQQGLLGRAVIGVAGAQGVRIDAQPADELVVIGAGDHVIGPEHPAPERFFEPVNCRHRDRIDHLLVELGVGLRGLKPVLGQKVLAVQIDRLVEHAARGVEVDDLDVFPDRTVGKDGGAVIVAFPRNVDGDFIDAPCGNLGAEAWVERVDPETPSARRIGNGYVFDHFPRYLSSDPNKISRCVRSAHV